MQRMRKKEVQESCFPWGRAPKGSWLSQLPKTAPGFTLVELVVVIAIMAILAGVGTVAYSGYIEHTNKELDRVTVGNIERAVEMGSYAETYEVPFQLEGEGTQMPVGFIVLTQDKATILESSSAKSVTSVPCEMETFDGSYLYYNGSQADFEAEVVHSQYQQEIGCKTKTFYLDLFPYDSSKFIEAPSETYCSAHSDIQMIKCNLWNEGGTPPTSLGKLTDEELNSKYEEKIVIFLNDSTVYTAEEGHGEGESFEKEGVIVTEYDSEDHGVSANGALQEAIKSAYGTNSISLNYDNWKVKDLSKDIPSIYSSGVEGFIEKVKEMQANPLITISDSDLVEIAGAVSRQDFDSSTFLQHWMAVDAADDDTSMTSQSFGIADVSGYFGMRMMYNQSFASYMLQNTTPEMTHNGEDLTEHANNIIEYIAGTAINPVCRYAFKNSYSVKCEDCYKLYEEYVESGASLANAKAVYDVMATISSEGLEALANGGLFEYEKYANYIAEVNKMYKLVDDYARSDGNDSCIVIEVTAENGATSCKVYPEEADPRT